PDREGLVSSGQVGAVGEDDVNHGLVGVADCTEESEDLHDCVSLFCSSYWVVSLAYHRCGGVATPGAFGVPCGGSDILGPEHLREGWAGVGLGGFDVGEGAVGKDTNGGCRGVCDLT